MKGRGYMVPKRNNNMNITQETAAEKNKKWEQLKKKGMEQPRLALENLERIRKEVEAILA